MPNCSVVGCYINNKSGYHPKLTLHKLPTNKEKRQIWLEKIGVENLKMSTKKVYICSLHFEESCFNLNLNRVTLRPDAVPSRTILACRICLVIDAKLVSMRMYKLEQAYENLTGISLSEEDKLPQKLCMECAQRLLNCNQFRLKSLRANSLMLEVIENDDYLTAQNIKAINRINNQLTSSLSTKHFEVDHYDYDFKCEDEPVLMQEDSPTPAIDDIEGEEYEIFTTEEIPDENYDGLIETINQSEFDEDGITDTDVLNEKDDGSEKEYVMSNKENYSSDDSVQLEKCDTKKTIKRKKVDDKPVKADKKAKKVKDSTEPKLENFTITNMTFEEQIAEIVKRQESSTYKNAVFKCTTCFKGFVDKHAYNSHMHRHSNQSGEHVCEICKIHFKDRSRLRIHKTGFHKEKFSCKQWQCSYVTTNRTSALLHERWHKGTKYRCPHCPDEFVKITTYKGHIRIKHPTGDFVCGLCGYSFVSTNGLEQHKSLKHRLDNQQIPEDGPLCELCNVRFISSEAHKQHLSVSPRHNPGPRRRNAAPKMSISVRQSYEGPIHCEVCGLQLNSFRAYNGHFRRMHPDKNRTTFPKMRYPCMCEVCGRIFPNSSLLKDHTWVHTTECPFKCESCGKSFKTERRLVVHKHAHNRIGGSYVCEICGEQFSKFSKRERHMLIHTGLRPFNCEICGKGFKSKAEKIAHIKFVHLKKPWPKKRNKGQQTPDSRQNSSLLKDHTWVHTSECPFKCESCGKSFKTERRLVVHKHAHNRIGGSYVCEICGEQFRKFSKRERHMLIHTGLRPFNCEICGKGFKSKAEKIAHIKFVHLKKPWPKKRNNGQQRPDSRQNSSLLKDHTWVHTSECPFKCESCGKSFKTERRLVVHKHAHNRIGGSYVCEICGEQFRKFSKRERHMLIHTGLRPFNCEICGKGFKSKAEKIAHIKFVHLKKPWPKKRNNGQQRPDSRQNSSLLKDHTWVHTSECPFKCESCGKSFKTERRLVVHKHAHNRIGGSYVCEICGEQFRKFSKRERHMLIHTGLRPFNCEICGKGFKSKAEKIAHIKFVHLKKPWPKKRNNGQQRPDSRQDQSPPQDEDSDSQAPMSPPCEPEDQEMGDMEVEMGDMDSIIGDKPFIYILTTE